MTNNKSEKIHTEQKVMMTRMHQSDGVCEMKIILRTPKLKKDDKAHYIDGVEITPIELHQKDSSSKYYYYADEELDPDDQSITVNKQDLQQLINEKKLDLDTGKTLIEALDEHEAIHAISYKDKGTSTEQERNQKIQSIIEKNQKELPKRTAAMRHLIEIKEALKKDLEADKLGSIFKKNVDTENCFGITKPLMDRLNYLPELLHNAELIYPQDGSSVYRITSTLSNKSEKGIGPIGFEHTLLYNKKAKSVEDAFRKYLEDMEDALKVFLEYWAFANKQDAFCYEADITDVMAVSAPERKSYFSVKEKVRFWELSQLLERTYLTLSLKHNGKWIKVRHPFLNLAITASNKKNQENIEGYPNKTVARVLNPDDFQKRASIATEISNGTLKLPAKDIMLALTPQTRASQRRDAIAATYDENFLIKRAGLEKTQRSNPTMARKRLAEKLDRIEEAKAIDEWQKTSNGKYLLKQRKSKK